MTTKFVTGFEAEGCKATCKICKQPAEILVCWCRKVEACPACLAKHLDQCKAPHP